MKLQVAINFPHGCLELQRVDGASGSGPGGRAKCLRTLHSLDEALQALRGQSTQLLASPSSSPRKLGSIHPVFQSPAKAPRRRLQYERQAREGVQLVQSCSSAQLRDGAIMLQAAASVPEGAAEAVDAGAMEALVGAAASMLPSTVMGTTEQLTLLTLTCATLLDASSAMSGPQRGAAAERLVGALAAALSDTCANPVLLCKLLLALLQRPDVRLEAVRQGLATAISSAYLRKSPLLEPLAAALLSPAPPSGRAHSSSPGGMTLQASATPPSSGHGLGAGRTPSPMPTGLRLSGTKLSVPRLHLQSEEESPTGPATGGLTRATRRDLSLSPTEWEPPSAAATPPWATPRPRSANKDVSAAAEMAQMAEALGESLMAMDLPSTVAHKRSADALKAPKSDDSIPKGRQKNSKVLNRS